MNLNWVQNSVTGPTRIRYTIKDLMTITLTWTIWDMCSVALELTMYWINAVQRIIYAHVLYQVYGMQSADTKKIWEFLPLFPSIIPQHWHSDAALTRARLLEADDLATRLRVSNTCLWDLSIVLMPTTWRVWQVLSDAGTPVQFSKLVIVTLCRPSSAVLCNLSGRLKREAQWDQATILYMHRCTVHVQL